MTGGHRKIIGVVEAKKLSLRPQGVLVQAERYSRGLDQIPRYQGEFGVPFLHVLSSASEQESARLLGVQAFGLVPIVLMAQNSRGVPTYLGRQDIVGFLANIFVEQIPWQRYTLSAV